MMSFVAASMQPEVVYAREWDTGGHNARVPGHDPECWASVKIPWRPGADKRHEWQIQGVNALSLPITMGLCHVEVPAARAECFSTAWAAWFQAWTQLPPAAELSNMPAAWVCVPFVASNCHVASSQAKTTTPSVSSQPEN